MKTLVSLAILLPLAAACTDPWTLAHDDALAIIARTAPRGADCEPGSRHNAGIYCMLESLQGPNSLLPESEESELRIGLYFELTSKKPRQLRLRQAKLAALRVYLDGATWQPLDVTDGLEGSRLLHATTAILLSGSTERTVRVSTEMMAKIRSSVVGRSGHREPRNRVYRVSSNEPGFLYVLVTSGGGPDAIALFPRFGLEEVDDDTAGLVAPIVDDAHAWLRALRTLRDAGPDLWGMLHAKACMALPTCATHCTFSDQRPRTPEAKLRACKEALAPVLSPMLVSDERDELQLLSAPSWLGSAPRGRYTWTVSHATPCCEHTRMLGTNEMVVKGKDMTLAMSGTARHAMGTIVEAGWTRSWTGTSLAATFQASESEPPVVIGVVRPKRKPSKRAKRLLREVLHRKGKSVNVFHEALACADSRPKPGPGVAAYIATTKLAKQPTTNPAPRNLVFDDRALFYLAEWAVHLASARHTAELSFVDLRDDKTKTAVATRGKDEELVAPKGWTPSSEPDELELVLPKPTPMALRVWKIDTGAAPPILLYIDPRGRLIAVRRGALAMLHEGWRWGASLPCKTCCPESGGLRDGWGIKGYPP